MKYIRLSVVSFLSILVLNRAIAQSNDSGKKSSAIEMDLSFSGTVIDSENNMPLEFASISVLNKAQGTLTNASGSFTLRLSSDSKSDTLLISMVGYEPVRIAMFERGENVVIKMEAQSFVLNEVEVTDKKITVGEIFKEIKARVKSNYPIEEYEMECFYREIKKKNDVYQSLLEAALVILDRGYDHPKSSESGFIREVRGSSKFTNPYSNFWQENNLLRETLGLNAVRHPSSSPSVFGDDVYQLNDITMLNDKPVYVLVSDITKNDAWQRTLYVDVETYAIYRSEEVIRNYGMSWKVEGSDSVYMRLTKGVSVLEFKPYHGKLYLNHIRHDVENEYFNPLTNAVLERFTIINDLMVNNIYEEAVGHTAGLRKVENYALELQVTPYNEVFWQRYNHIEQTPIEIELMKDLLKKGTLNDQFVKSSQKATTGKKAQSKRKSNHAD